MSLFFLKAKSIFLNKYFVGFLIIVAAFSNVIHRTAMNGFVDRCDGYNYLADGMAMTKMNREFMNPQVNTYEDFQKSLLTYKFNEIPYPNKLFSLMAVKTTLDEDYLYPAHTTWVNVLAVSIALTMLWMMLTKLSDLKVATVSICLVIINNKLNQFLGRPLSDPLAWSLILTSVVAFLSLHKFSRWIASFILGFAFAFRLQSFFVLISQFIYEIVSYRKGLQSKKQMLLNLLISMGVSYITFKLIVYGIESYYYSTNKTVSGGAFDYYKTWAQHSLSSLNMSDMFDYFTNNLEMIFASFPISILGSIYLPFEYKNDLRIRFLRWFAFSGLFLPILFYTIAPGFDLRYLIYSIPIMTFLTTLNLFTLIKRYTSSFSSLVENGAYILVALFLVKTTLNAPFTLTGTEVTEYFSRRLPLVKTETPASKGYILTNKALAGGFFKNFNVIRQPPVDVFLKGDNTNVSAIVMFFDMACSSDPNFNPMDYLKYERLVDDHHNVFLRDVSYENSSKEIVVFFNRSFMNNK